MTATSSARSRLIFPSGEKKTIHAVGLGLNQSSVRHPAGVRSPMYHGTSHEITNGQVEPSEALVL
jgi:hypothetical protein